VKSRFLLHFLGVRRQTLALRAVLALGLLLLAWGAAAPVLADTMRGVVIVVIDGDTVLFKPDHYGAASRAFLKIRLADIDAPEKGQPYGEASARALAAWVLNQRVEVDTIATDVYGRTIARIRSGTLQVNEEMVRQGYAWASTWSRSNAALRDTQQLARHAQRGLWGDDSPTPPWVWRRAQAAPAH
jgi:micrococcal nuclease